MSETVLEPTTVVYVAPEGATFAGEPARHLNCHITTETNDVVLLEVDLGLR